MVGWNQESCLPLVGVIMHRADDLSPWRSHPGWAPGCNDLWPEGKGYMGHAGVGGQKEWSDRQVKLWSNTREIRGKNMLLFVLFTFSIAAQGQKHCQSYLIFMSQMLSSLLHELKALFSNVSSELYGPTCYQCLCKNEALKKLHLKSTIKCFKEVKIDKWPDLSDSFSLVDCCVRINHKYDS